MGFASDVLVLELQNIVTLQTCNHVFLGDTKGLCTRKPSASASIRTITNGRFACCCTNASSFAFDSSICACIVLVVSAISACSVRLTFCSDPRSSSVCARRSSVFSSLSSSSYADGEHPATTPRRTRLEALWPKTLKRYTYLNKLTSLLLENPKLGQPLAKRHGRRGRGASNN